MRIKDSASFPYPVLLGGNGDYGDRQFRLDLGVQETPAAGSVILDGTMTLDDPTIRQLVDSGQAAAGLMITCQDTYLDQFEKCGLGDISLDLSGGRVRGLVYVRGVVVVTRDNLALESEWINAEFLPEARIVRAGDFIALTEERSFEAGLEKLAPLESIFRLKLQEDMTEGVFSVYLENDAIEILVAPSLHRFLSLLRAQPRRDILLSSLYLPVVMSVLDAMRDEEVYADRRWYGVIKARCNAEGIDSSRDDFAESAQKLLDAPMGYLQKVIEKESE